MRVLVVGAGGREHAIALGLVRSGCEVVAVAPAGHPGLSAVARKVVPAEPTAPEAIARIARDERVDFVVIGPERPLAAGVADVLRAQETPVVGPSKDGARLESSKQFARELLARHAIPVSPRTVPVAHVDEVDRRIADFPEPFVVKPVGLTAGKGVWVQGIDFQTKAEGASYAKRLLATGSSGGILLEERLDGEEFSLMAFVTDSGLYPMPVVQDYKRAGANDTGPNTGGMGAYSQRDHLLPFLSASAVESAMETMRRTVEAMRQEGIPYRGVLYGGFMLTAQGPRVVEYNVRFGDPEGINVLSLYEEGNLGELLYGVAVGRVDPGLVRFRPRSTVVKYLVPPGYPTKPAVAGILRLDAPRIERLGVEIRYANVTAAGPGAVRLGRSRSLALVGEASAIHEASRRVEAALAHVRGAYELRHDIGTSEDVARRVEHMRRLLSPGAKPSPLPLSVAAPGAPPASHAAPDLRLSSSGAAEI